MVCLKYCAAVTKNEINLYVLVWKRALDKLGNWYVHKKKSGGIYTKQF